MEHGGNRLELGDFPRLMSWGYRNALFSLKKYFSYVPIAILFPIVLDSWLFQTLGGSLHLLNMDGFQASFARTIASICSALEKQHHLPLRTVPWPSICSALENTYEHLWSIINKYEKHNFHVVNPVSSNSNAHPFLLTINLWLVNKTIPSHGRFIIGFTTLTIVNNYSPLLAIDNS